MGKHTEGSDHASANNVCSTRGLSEAEEGFCGGSDLPGTMCALGWEREGWVRACRVRAGEGLTTGL